jgi:hypothetical protein
MQEMPQILLTHILHAVLCDSIRMKKLKNKMANIFLLFILMINIFFIQAEPVYSAQWYFAAATKNRYYFVDAGNIRISDTNITFWTMNMDIKTGKVRSIKRCTIDCAVDTCTVNEVYKYGLNGTLSEVISYTNNLEWYVVPPHSATKSVENLLCSDGAPRRNMNNYLMLLFSEVK